MKHCRKAGVKPGLRLEVRNGDQLLYVLLAANNRGLAWIQRFYPPMIKKRLKSTGMKGPGNSMSMCQEFT